MMFSRIETLSERDVPTVTLRQESPSIGKYCDCKTFSRASEKIAKMVNEDKVGLVSYRAVEGQ